MAASGLITSSKKTFLSPPAAANSADIGEVTITAPSVPPSTMIAAVTCVTSETLPPSRISPPSRDAMATTTPPRLAKSGLVLRNFARAPAFSAMHYVLAHGSCLLCHRRQ